MTSHTVPQVKGACHVRSADQQNGNVQQCEQGRVQFRGTEFFGLHLINRKNFE